MSDLTWNELYIQNLEKLNIIAELEKNWNCYNADPIDIDVINKTRIILKELCIQSKLFPTAANEIQLEWEPDNNHYLEISIGKGRSEVYTKIYEKDSTMFIGGVKYLKSINAVIKLFYENYEDDINGR
jgi:hypothetical protein